MFPTLATVEAEVADWLDPHWVVGSVTDRLEAVLAMDPGPQTMAALVFLARHPMSPADRVLAALAWERQASHATAQMYAAVAAATTPDPATTPDFATTTDSVTTTDSATTHPAGSPTAGDSGDAVNLPAELLEVEVGLALRKSEAGTRALVEFARRVVDSFPVLFGLLERGAATLAHARALDDATTTLTPAQAGTIDATVSHRAAGLTVPAFRRVLRRAVAALDPDTDRRREAQARREQSGARLVPAGDGMTTLAVTMPTVEAVPAMAALNDRADRLRTTADDRSHGQRQVQALLDALDTAPEKGTGRLRVRRSAQIVAFIDLPSLLGLRNNPGELAGYGPISADQVRELLGRDGSTLRRLVFDPLTGAVTDYSVERYHPDAHLRELLEVRDVTCRYPGCTRTAVYCDTEHCHPYDCGGQTSPGNCALMCRRHHNRKTHDGFRYRRPDPSTGETVWTTPLGFTYRQRAAAYHPTGRDTGDTVPIKAADRGSPPPGSDPNGHGDASPSASTSTATWIPHPPRRPSPRGTPAPSGDDRPGDDPPF
ncbi:MAG TPA: DUF222 domain-containing protein [Mycobacteriales bacterium]|nr:DUF222 domain-containing protein [Mycobacteriales bacterium]